MHKAIHISFFLIICLSCTDEKDNVGISVRAGSWMCGKTMNEMEWLRLLIVESETDMAKRGDIYAGKVDGRMLFIHQPAVMSCLACVVYDCDGNKLDTSTMDHEKLRTIMQSQNRIHDAYS